jgi:hypothetical protein
MFDRFVRGIRESLSKDKQECSNIRPMYDGDLAFLKHFEKGGPINETDVATAERLARVGLVRFGTKVDVNVDNEEIIVTQTLKTTERGRAILRF